MRALCIAAGLRILAALYGAVAIKDAYGGNDLLLLAPLAAAAGQAALLVAAAALVTLAKRFVEARTAERSDRKDVSIP